MRRLKHHAPTLITTFLLIVFWEIVVRFFGIPIYLLPPPSLILSQIWSDLYSGLIGPHFLTTLVEVVLGFIIAALTGVCLGTLIGLVPLFERIIYPYILALQTVPKIAIAPLILIWVGYGVQSKIIIAALIAFFPILVNVIMGLSVIDRDTVDLMRSLGSSPMQTFAKARLPNMLPYLFAGLEIGIIFSLIGAIVGEFIGSSTGLGSLIIQRQGAIDVLGVFSALFYLSVMGTLLHGLLRLVRRRFIFWGFESEEVSM